MHPGTRHHLRLALVPAIMVGLTLSVRGLDAADPGTDLDGCQERIECYEMALADQREALSVCEQKVGEAIEAGQAASARGDQTAVAARQADRVTVEGLRQLYTDKVVDTLEKLGAEYEKLAEKQRAMRLYAEAFEHICLAAGVWDERGEVQDKQAARVSQQSGFDAAGVASERAYEAYRRAYAKWQDAARLLATLEQKNDDRQVATHLEASQLKSMNALRAATSAYFSAYQMHRKNAKGQVIDIFSCSVGEEWRLTAQAQQNYERLAKTLAAVEKTL